MVHPKKEKPVVGVQECDLFVSNDLKKRTGKLQAGQEISIEEEWDWAVRVSTADGKKGWSPLLYLHFVGIRPP